MKVEDIPVAIGWLMENEGDKDERGSCLRAAEFLRREFVKRDAVLDARVAQKFGATAEQVHETLVKNGFKNYFNGWDKPITE